MSIESAKAFAERITTDEAFRIQLQKASSGKEHQALVQAAGYNFTQEEWKIVMSELSEQQLEAVAGGASTVVSYNIPGASPDAFPTSAEWLAKVAPERVTPIDGKGPL
jgi:predicted ribosomally synthesized peptide with nif11-like leader